MEGARAQSAAATPVAHVTGLGAVSCFGEGTDALIEGVFAGRSGIGPRRRLAGIDCLTAVAAEVPPGPEMPDNPAELPLHFATHAAREALATTPAELRQLQLVVATTKADMSGILGAGTGNGSGARLARALADRLGIERAPRAVSSACASGLTALAVAARMIGAGTASQVLVVGTDSINAFILRGFSALLALSADACRPFDRDRDGLTVGEGAGAILLTAYPGQTCLARLTGWGESNDANHITGPSRDGTGLALAIERSLDKAGIGPEELDAMHLHGTGTPYNDAMESRALERLFPAATELPVAAGSKAQIGHTLGAAGVLESIIAIACLQRSQVPGNLRLTHPEDDSRLRLPTVPTRLPRAERILKIAAGFGGINAALVFER